MFQYFKNIWLKLFKKDKKLNNKDNSDINIISCKIKYIKNNKK
jgi:hypothetical protein